MDDNPVFDNRWECFILSFIIQLNYPACQYLKSSCFLKKKIGGIGSPIFGKVCKVSGKRRNWVEKGYFLTKEDKVDITRSIYFVGLLQFLAIVGSVVGYQFYVPLKYCRQIKSSGKPTTFRSYLLMLPFQQIRHLLHRVECGNRHLNKYRIPVAH